MPNKLYTLPSFEKKKELLDNLNSRLQLHYESSLEFRRIINGFFADKLPAKSLENLPFIPVRLFKTLDLKSVADSDIVKTMTSSGTSGQGASKIYLDRATVKRQQEALVSIFKAQTEHSRIPMLIIDASSTIKNRSRFNARAAGILGFSMFGKRSVFALNDDLTINLSVVREFFDKYGNEPFLLFGFTYIVYRDFLLSLKKSGICFPENKGLLIHGGGWKKLEELSISQGELKTLVTEVLGVSRVYDYYGMVEQTGSIFFECNKGFFHASEWSDLIIRDVESLRPLKNGLSGLIQLLSIVPESYPGNSILTEDLGTIYGEDDCVCGRKGKYFKVHGRVKNSEIRGCSNVIQN
jgi:phenylacetate-coenzyme A ligase PaaK-like adenylate-forming protein